VCSTSIEAPNYVEMFPAYYIFNSLLILLLVLHLFWTYVILKIAYKSMVAGQVMLQQNNVNTIDTVHISLLIIVFDYFVPSVQPQSLE
jgi:hypothetical protein